MTTTAAQTCLNTAPLTTGNTNAERQSAARHRAEELTSHITPLRDAGKSIREIATALTASGIPTALGGAWGPSQVLGLIRRLKEQPSDSIGEDADPLATGPILLPA